MMANGPQSVAQSQEGPPLRGLFADNFILSEPPKPAPAVTFSDREGGAVTLVDFRGRVLLLNIWATWCAPCVREMPSLDRLQAALGAEGLSVVALSVDREGLAAVEPFYRRLSLEALDIYLDPANEVGRSFTVPGLPTSYLIDPEGALVGALAGPAEWDSPEAQALIRHYLPQDAGDVELLETKADDDLPEADCNCGGPKAAKARQSKKAAAPSLPAAQRVGTGSSPE